MMRHMGILLVACLMAVFILFTGPTQELAHYSFNESTEDSITVADTSVSSNMITESVQTVIEKVQVDFLFPFADHLANQTVHHANFTSPQHLDLTNAFFGFICVVQHQSNYLPNSI